ITAGVLLILLVLASLNMGTMKYSFNLMNSFPSDISSRQGFEILEEQFSPGQLAPVSVILQSDKEIALEPSFVKKVASLTQSLKKQGNIKAITPDITPDLSKANATLPRNFLSQENHAIKLQMILQENPYDEVALDLLDTLRNNSEKLLKESGFDPSRYSLHYAGQTAEQLDVRNMNQQDTIMVFSLITVLITVMLIFQARSVRLAMTMIVTMLLSYVATLGLGWMVFHSILGYDSISYRLPVYTFVFLIALGVDYNIMLVSRIREEARNYEWKQAVSRGVALTGGVISSAGIILAATFCVLITQPLQELFLFGLTMGMGILIDTFLVRGMLLPAIITLIGKRSNRKKQSVPISMD
ncbi:MMPL family transporter, partial [Aneurinibacillus aneurinilyticus]|uniref:MMPL family transporter n=1 Tax=Aneurinibacillus aneurinilyticus TaxID=1391 RepID=UPI0035267F7C